ncbi:MAG TPA: TonB-dependent receptor [Pyrinomonadaceae bacterium]|nr:TonB-dependent receptor [Pyrinomonadaceae bacterium]
MKTTDQDSRSDRLSFKHKSFSILTLLLLLTPFPFVAVGQDSVASPATLSVRVMDPQAAALAKAEVTLYTRDNHIRIKCLTDRAGNCRFEQLAPGEYLIEAEATGFARAPTQIARIEKNAGASLDISLPLAGVSEQVVVTAQGTAQPVDEVSKAVSVVDSREIDERDESSVTDVLRTVPGLRVQQLGGPGRLVSIKARGLRNQDTAVLIDGLRFRDATTGDATSFLGDFLVTNLDRVEVLRGSGSSLYGTNAIGGVVNIVTDEGGGPTHGNILLEGGGLGLFRGRAQVAGGNSRFLYSAGATHLNVAHGIDGDDAARNTSGKGRVTLRLTPTTTLSGRVYAGTSFVQLNSSPSVIGTFPASTIVDAVPLPLAELRRYEMGVPLGQLNLDGATFIPDANDPDASAASRFFNGVVTFTQRPVEDFGYTISYQGLATRRSNSNGPAGIGFQPFGGSDRTLDDGRIHTVNAQLDFRLGKYNFVNAGYEFEHAGFANQSFSGNPADNFSTDVSERTNTFFVQDQVRFLEERLQISAAFRAQFFSLNTPKFTPTAGAPYAGIAFESPGTSYTGDGSIAYLLRGTHTKLRAHVGNGYRAPSLFERFGTSFFGGFFAPLGDPRLRPERSIAFDAGIDQSFGDNRVRLSATYFYTRLQEVIGFDFSGKINPLTDPFGRFFGYLNTGGGLARGVELSATLSPTRTLDVFTSYTYTNSDQRTPQVGGSGVISSLVVPTHQFSAVATQRIGRRVFLNFDLTATSAYLAPVFPNVYRFKNLIKADFGGSYELSLTDRRRLRLFGYLDNLFNRENFESGFQTPGRTARAGASLSF